MNTDDRNRMALLALKLKAGIPLSPAEQAEWDHGATWRDRVPLLVSELRAGATLSPEDQAYWDREARWSDKLAAGLPLTDAEEQQRAGLKAAVYSVRGDGVLVVEAPPMSVDDWKRNVAKSRGAPAKLMADVVTEKPQIAAEK